MTKSVVKVEIDEFNTIVNNYIKMTEFKDRKKIRVICIANFFDGGTAIYEDYEGNTYRVPPGAVDERLQEVKVPLKYEHLTVKEKLSLERPVFRVKDLIQELLKVNQEAPIYIGSRYYDYINEFRVDEHPDEDGALVLI